MQFSNYKWYRKYRGGHWEQWWSNITNSFIWIRVDKCSQGYYYEYNKEVTWQPHCCNNLQQCENYNIPTLIPWDS